MEKNGRPESLFVFSSDSVRAVVVAPLHHGSLARGSYSLGISTEKEEAGWVGFFVGPGEGVLGAKNNTTPIKQRGNVYCTSFLANCFQITLI